MKMLFRLLQEEHGTTVMEYSLITSLISLAGISAVVAFDIQFFTWFAR